jgi:O-antigen biosynthesis protein WbqV
MLTLQDHKRAVSFSCDVMASVASFVVAFSAHSQKIPSTGEDLKTLALGALVIVVISAATFHCVQLDRTIWRYFSFSDLKKIGAAATAIGVLLSLAMLVLLPNKQLSGALALTYWFVLVVFLGSPRFAYRLVKTRIASRAVARRTVPVLLIGSGGGAAAFIRFLHNDPDVPYRAVGILELHRNGNLGRAIAGVPVLGGVEELAAVKARLAAQGKAPERLIICTKITPLNQELARNLINEAETLALRVERMPALTDFKRPLVDGKLELQQVSVEDLLGRPQVAIDLDAIHSLLHERVVLVTGAGGSIGSELVRQIARFRPSQILLLEASEYGLFMISTEIGEAYPGLPRQSLLCDVRDRRRMMRLFQSYKPEVVFHAAALKHVPMVELNPSQGVATNVLGTRNVADATAACGAAAMVLISTDKAVAPASMMGATKRLAELYCQALDRSNGPNSAAGRTRFMIVRFGNVLGSSGSVVPLFQHQLAKGGPLTVTHPEADRYFMTIREAVSLVLQASAHGISERDEFGRIFVLDMGEPIKITDLARQIIRLSGLRPDVDIKLEFTGLRPGERLHEKLFDENEDLMTSSVAGVLGATSTPPDLGSLNALLDELGHIIAEDNHAAVRTTVGQAIARFVSSQYKEKPDLSAAVGKLPKSARQRSVKLELVVMQEGW